MAESAESIEDRGVPEIREETLAVRGKGIGGNSLLRAAN